MICNILMTGFSYDSLVIFCDFEEFLAAQLLLPLSVMTVVTLYSNLTRFCDFALRNFLSLLVPRV